jgi:hypothetical protein
MNKVLLTVALGSFLAAGPVAAQQFPEQHRVFVEARGGVVAPTFDIADVATVGGSYGATLGLHTMTNWVLMASFDHGMHRDEPTETADIETLHYMAQLGFSVKRPFVERGWELVLNLGAGAVTFDVEGADTSTYFAINAGGKILYHFNPAFSLVFSPQGNIAFTDEDELETGNAWVWPLTAGLRLTF